MAKIDPVTRKWIKNEADSIAASKGGCWFDEAQAEYVVEWIQSHCYLYQGACAGQPMILGDWQLDATMRMFGWMRFSQHWAKHDAQKGLPPEECGIIRRFRQASIWVPKKNAKSPTLAAWGLYLLCGDGESGQNVYFGAKDGKQAKRIVGEHAMQSVAQMQRQGIPLFDELKTNVHECTIRHLPTNSMMALLSSANSSHQDALHGINGSVLIDEVHVVDKHFMEVIRQAGISRRNPLQIQVSTAGNNPDSYGKERFDYCLKVEAGHVEDQELLPIVYAVPQDTTDAEIDTEPLKFARIANPALGRLIDEDEFLRSYGSMRQSSSDWSNFKFERLNLWQNSSNPWLDLRKWGQCGSDLGLDEIRELPCWGGFDLGRTQDATALALWFPMDDLLYLQLHFWITEKVKLSEAKQIPWSRWEEQGFVRVVPGDVVTDKALIADLIEIRDGLPNLQVIAFDPAHASNLSATLETEHGFPMLKFPQRPTYLTEPIAEFESLILQERVRHPRNPCLDWMVGNAHIKTYPSGLIEVVKPNHSKSIQRIDGVDAAVMGLAVYLQQDGIQVAEESIYSRPENERVVWL